jgi:hypothetical protein
MKVFHLAILVVAATLSPLYAGGPLAPMKFNDVREIAPGVFFRYSSISATDKSTPTTSKGIR